MLLLLPQTCSNEYNGGWDIMGKSTAARLLRRRGVLVHDSDAAVHRLLARGGEAVAAVEAALAALPDIVIRHETVPPALQPGRFLQIMTERVLATTPVTRHREARRRRANPRQDL